MAPENKQPEVHPVAYDTASMRPGPNGPGKLFKHEEVLAKYA